MGLQNMACMGWENEKHNVVAFAQSTRPTDTCERCPSRIRRTFSSERPGMYLMKWLSKKSLKTDALDQPVSVMIAAVPGEQPTYNSGMSRFPGKTKYGGIAWPAALPSPFSLYRRSLQVDNGQRLR
ncbi:hypothetical protein DPMN_186265 [Dreissena polymorpha]|uniref:Uncharacterized protein n=1 Tax=Dreissena polymorpha TaxID=45954 RepID=A0A9D4DN22_DREPO|nr:hypothetical protein DPMN_186265 [Dreissena polymorpha]